MDNKKSFVKTEQVLQIWQKGVDQILFPPHLVKEFAPDIVLDKITGSKVALRREYEDAVDTLIGEVLRISGSVREIFLQTDPMTLALYYDRILGATFALENLAKEGPVIQIPESITGLIRLLLFHKVDQ